MKHLKLFEDFHASSPFAKNSKPIYDMSKLNDVLNNKDLLLMVKKNPDDIKKHIEEALSKNEKLEDSDTLKKYGYGLDARMLMHDLLIKAYSYDYSNKK